MSSVDRLRKLLAARRAFVGKPLPDSGVLAQIARGEIDGIPKAGFYANPEVAAKLGLPGPAAYYDATLPNARGVRRHEVMHGIFKAAKADPELADVLPLWARVRGGRFEDELLARLASQEPGAVLYWPTSVYRSKDPVPYAVAGPLLKAAQFASEHPAAVGAMVTGAGGLAYGLSQDEIADEFDRQVRPDGYEQAAVIRRRRPNYTAP